MENKIVKSLKEINYKDYFLIRKHIEGVSSIRISRILAEFTKGFKFLSKYENTVSFFGSARAKENTPYYKEAVLLASYLSKEGYTIVTGGGGGIMEAANKGANEAGGGSIGVNIALLKSEGKNKYAKDSISFNYFFVRKVMLTFASQAYIFLPGGFGTLDEFFEIVTLIQTKKIKRIPIILIYKKYWQPLLSWIENTLYKEGRINKEDMKIYHLVDNAKEALDLLNKLDENEDNLEISKEESQLIKK